jgi:hypothetical protein
MNYEFWQYFGTSIGFAALAGMARTIRNGHYSGVAHTASVGVLAGFIGFGAAAVYVGNSYADWNPIGLALAALTGSLSKEVTDIVTRQILGKLLNVEIDKKLGERSDTVVPPNGTRDDKLEE